MNDRRQPTPHRPHAHGRAARTPVCAMLLVAASLAAACLSWSPPARAQTNAAQLPPVVSKITPQTAAPGVAVEVEGLRLGLDTDRETLAVFFLQNGREYKAESGGSGYTEGDSTKPQEVLVFVPEELAPGPCQVVVEVKGRRTEPYAMEVSATFEPPVLTDLQPVWVIPGEHVWVNGSGFTGKETAELTDSAGEVRRIENVGVTSDAGTVSFVLPEDVAEGVVSLRLIETRSGLGKASGALTLKVTRGVAPLQPALGFMKPVAPGQWLNLVVYGNTIYDRMTRVDVSFTQDGQTFSTTAPDLKPLRVLLPASLRAGPVELRLRAWIGEAASDWSDAYTYEVAKAPLAPVIYSVEIVPARAEAQVRQQDKIVATLPVTLDGKPRVRLPGTLKPETFEVRTRVWRGGSPGEWSEPQNYSCCDPNGPPSMPLDLPPLSQPTYVGPDAPESVTVHAGEGLLLRGDFHTSSAAEMQVFIAQPGQRISLTPAPVPGLGGYGLLVRLPRLLAPGPWQLTVQEGAAQTELPFKLQLK